MVENCHITTSVSDKTLTIKTTDFEQIGSVDTKWMTDIIITYTPHKELINQITFVKDGETIVTTYSFYFDPEEEIKLPQLLKLGAILSALE